MSATSTTVVAILRLRIATDTAFVSVRSWKADIGLAQGGYHVSARGRPHRLLDPPGLRTAQPTSPHGLRCGARQPDAGAPIGRQSDGGPTQGPGLPLAAGSQLPNPDLDRGSRSNGPLAVL